MDFRRPLNTVTPTLDADVLEVLSRADSELTGLQIQRMAARGSPQGIRNAADRLTAQGVLVRRSVGSAHLYRLNREHVAARWIEGLAGVRGQLIERLRTAVGEWSTPPLGAIIFGSVASGAATPESDLDLLIVRPRACDGDSPQWRSQLAGLQERATAWSGNDARIVEYGELEDLEGEPLLQEALREGIVLYGREHVLRHLAASTGPR